MAVKFKIDGSRLTRNNFADVLIDEVIYNKLLYYPDSNSKRKVIKGKVSTKILYLIWDMGGLLISLISERTHDESCVNC